MSAPETPRCSHGITKGVCTACLNDESPRAEAQRPAQNGLVCHCDDCALARASRVPAGETPPTIIAIRDFAADRYEEACMPAREIEKYNLFARGYLEIVEMCQRAASPGEAAPRPLGEYPREVQFQKLVAEMVDMLEDNFDESEVVTFEDVMRDWLKAWLKSARLKLAWGEAGTPPPQSKESKK